MDWFSWLSKSGLESSLVYEYGLAFDHNELQAEDLIYFNHEFLQSMGIAVAKHRLEIIKLAKKEIGAGPNSFSKLVLAISKTKKGLARRINKWVFHADAGSNKAAPEPTRYLEQWRGALSFTRKCKSEKELQLEKPPGWNTRKQAKSGPLDGRFPEKLMLTNRASKLSGPLDGKGHDRLLFSYRSPVLTGPHQDPWMQQRYVVPNRSPKPFGALDARYPCPMVCPENAKERVNGDYDDNSLWATLFQDMKPT